MLGLSIRLKLNFSGPWKNVFFIILRNYVICLNIACSEILCTFGAHPRKQGLDYLIDLKFGACNCWDKPIKNANFRNLSVLLLDI